MYHQTDSSNRDELGLQPSSTTRNGAVVVAAHCSSSVCCRRDTHRNVASSVAVVCRRLQRHFRYISFRLKRLSPKGSIELSSAIASSTCMSRLACEKDSWECDSLTSSPLYKNIRTIPFPVQVKHNTEPHNMITSNLRPC